MTILYICIRYYALAYLVIHAYSVYPVYVSKGKNLTIADLEASINTQLSSSVCFFLPVEIRANF